MCNEKNVENSDDIETSNKICNSCGREKDRLYSIADFGHTKESLYLYMKEYLNIFTEDISNNEDEDDEKEDLFPGYICDCNHCLDCIKICYGLEFYDNLKLQSPESRELQYFSCQKCYGILHPLSILQHEKEIKEFGIPKCPTCNNEIEKRALGVYTYKINPDTAFELLEDDFRFGCKDKTNQEIIDDICCCYYCEKCFDSQDYVNDETCKKCGKNNIVLFYLGNHFHIKNPKVETFLQNIYNHINLKN